MDETVDGGCSTKPSINVINKNKFTKCLTASHVTVYGFLCAVRSSNDRQRPCLCGSKEPTSSGGTT